MNGKMIILAAAICFLAACVKRTPEWIDHVGWTITGSVPDSDFEIMEALRTIREMTPFEVPEEWWGGVIRFAPIVVNDPRVAGSWIGGTYKARSAEFAIATTRHTADGLATLITRIEDMALAHEVGHYLWTRAGRPNSDHPSDFQAWWMNVNAEIARRLGR